MSDRGAIDGDNLSRDTEHRPRNNCHYSPDSGRCGRSASPSPPSPALSPSGRPPRGPPPSANRDPNYCPHGVYPTRGEDEWLALAVASEPEWRALAELVGGKDLLEDGRFASHRDRKRNEDADDSLIGRWTAEHDR